MLGIDNGSHYRFCYLLLLRSICNKQDHSDLARTARSETTFQPRPRSSCYEVRVCTCACVCVRGYPYMQKPAGHFSMSAGHFFACPRLVLLTMGDGRSTSKYFVISTSVHHATRCAMAVCGSTFQLLEWQTRPWPIECGDLGKGEFLASCYS